MQHKFSHFISEQDVAAFGRLSGDMNLLHFDEEFCKNTVFKAPIVHGQLLLAYLSADLVYAFGNGVIYLSQTANFKAPVYPNSLIEIIIEGVRLERKTLASFQISNYSETCVEGNLVIKEPK